MESYNPRISTPTASRRALRMTQFFVLVLFLVGGSVVNAWTTITATHRNRNHRHDQATLTRRRSTRTPSSSSSSSLIQQSLFALKYHNQRFFSSSKVTSALFATIPSKNTDADVSSSHQEDEDDDHDRNQEDKDNLLFQQLLAAISSSSSDDDNNNDNSPPPLLRLDNQDDGIRGVYLNRPATKGQTLLEIPLRHCLRDDQPPSWLMGEDNDSTNGDDEDEERDYGWATRLAARVVDLQLQRQRDSTAREDDFIWQKLWLDLLPGPAHLRASLPVHWPSTLLETVQCTDLELAVDSAFFSRAMAEQDLLDALLEKKKNPDEEEDTPQLYPNLIENAFDVVQTRSCRVVLPTENEEKEESDAIDYDEEEDYDGQVSGRPLRLLAPVFDLINHHPTQPNAEFLVMQMSEKDDQDNFNLVVKALTDIPEDEQIWIDYGESARPDWKCLQSYGFVPTFHPANSPTSSSSCNYEDHTAELFLEGQRFYVGPDSVSQELVNAMVLSSSSSSSSAAGALTPDIALRLAERIAEAAYHILLDKEKSGIQGDTDDDEDDDLTDNEEETEEQEYSVETVISEQLAATLRWNQHRVLMTCSMGLRDWAMKHP